MTLLKTIIFTVVAPGTITVYLPHVLLSSPTAPPPLPIGLLRSLGFIPLVLGAAIYFRCAWDFAFAGRGTPAPIDPPKELVVRGLYRYVRNPMYVGVLTVLLGEVLSFASIGLLAYAGVVFLGFHLFVVFYEEPALQRKFGESYQRYCESVPRWRARMRMNGNGKSSCNSGRD